MVYGTLYRKLYTCSNTASGTSLRPRPRPRTVAGDRLFLPGVKQRSTSIDRGWCVDDGAVWAKTDASHRRQGQGTRVHGVPVDFLGQRDDWWTSEVALAVIGLWTIVNSEAIRVGTVTAPEQLIAFLVDRHLVGLSSSWYCYGWSFACLDQTFLGKMKMRLGLELGPKALGSSSPGESRIEMSEQLSERGFDFWSNSKGSSWRWSLTN